MIQYRAGYKYQLHVDYTVIINIRPETPIFTPFIILLTNGELTLRAGYAWDGPSGPTIDTQNFMRGSLIHDALYQLMRAGILSLRCRDLADRLLKKICKEDGMWSIRAQWVYFGVHKFGEKAAKPQLDRIYTAP